MPAENLAKMQSLCKTIQKLYQIEKVVFYKKWHKTSHRCRKVDDFCEKSITRESICGHFSSGGSAWGPYKRSTFFEKCDFQKTRACVQKTTAPKKVQISSNSTKSLEKWSKVVEKWKSEFSVKVTRNVAQVQKNRRCRWKVHNSRIHLRSFFIWGAGLGAL